MILLVRSSTVNEWLPSVFPLTYALVTKIGHAQIILCLSAILHEMFLLRLCLPKTLNVKFAEGVRNLGLMEK